MYTFEVLLIKFFGLLLFIKETRGAASVEESRKKE